MKISLPKKRKVVQNPFRDHDADNSESEYTVLPQPPERNPEKARELKELGCHHAELGEYEAALTVWRQALEFDSNMHTVYEMMAQVHLELGELMRAVRCAESAVHAAPSWLPALQTLARCQRELGEVQLAHSSYCAALNLATQSTDTAEQTSAEALPSLRLEFEEIRQILRQQQMVCEQIGRDMLRADSDDLKEVHLCKHNLANRAAVVRPKDET